MSLVDTNWLEKNINKVKVIDCSWHMPAENRNAEEEFKNEHIPKAIFFDLDKNSKNNTDLPHMLPTLDEWNEIVSNLGISKDDNLENIAESTKHFIKKNKDGVINESADLLYHLLVLWVSTGIDPGEVWEELSNRQLKSGFEEKNGRS